MEEWCDMLKKLLPLLVCILILFSAELLADNQPQTEELPIGFTPEELLRLDEIGINHLTTAPPPGPGIRSCAEWEPSQGVIIRYPFGISYSLIAEMSEDLIVYTVVGSSSQQTTVTNNYQSNGVNMSNVEFIIAPTDSYWTRDYGPWFIFDGNGDFAIVDHIYNRPRPNDDAIPQEVGTYLNVPVYGMDLEATGGNYMSDGLGMAMATTLTTSENPGMTETEIDSLVEAFLGNEYFMYPDPLGEYIEHIDCWGKFLSPQKVLVLEVPSWHSQYDELEDAADSIGQLTSSWGQPYTVVRVLSSGSQAYTNSLILNDKVFVPISSSSYDAPALQAYQDAMPGYEVLGFTGSWYNTDALHCRTMGVPDSAMLFVHHVPIFEVYDDQNDYDIEVKIVDHSNTGVIADSLKIIYRVDSGAWQSSLLTAGVDPYMYQGSIPAQAFGSHVDYYIQAADNSGRVEYHPYIGEPGAHGFDVINAVPQIDLNQTLFTFETETGTKEMLYDTLAISNAGLGDLDWTATTTNSLWMSISPTSGTAPSDVEIEVNTQYAGVGTFYDTITVNCPEATNSPQQVEIVLTVNYSTPQVVSHYPLADATDIPLDADITVTFSIDMDPATIIADNFTVYGSTSLDHTFAVTYDQPTRTATLDPDASFERGEDISVDINPAVESANGMPLEGTYSWEFTSHANYNPNEPFNMYPADQSVDMPIDVTMSWECSDPDGDDLKYNIYFGTSNPPSLTATNLTEPSWTAPVDLENDMTYYWYVVAKDTYLGSTQGPLCSFATEVGYICGDANSDDEVNVSDAVYIINYVFTGGQAPEPLESGDSNCDGDVNVSDAVYIINFVFTGGNDPCDLDGNGQPDC